ncbi:MAG: hypothetical protein H0X63_11095 [Flavobacteriales bacterium]|nr:hypothetical protein [Flavobacteriales bacterium]
MKVYSSYEEINIELKIRKLESDIEKEKIKKSFFYLKESVSPAEIASSLLGNVAKKVFFGKLLIKILPFLRKT